MGLLAQLKLNTCILESYIVNRDRCIISCDIIATNNYIYTSLMLISISHVAKYTKTGWEKELVSSNDLFLVVYSRCATSCLG